MQANMQWIRCLFMALVMSCLCLQAPLSAECSADCLPCDGCGDAYRHARVCQVAAGWVFGGILVAGLAIAIFGGDCHCHHSHHGRERGHGHHGRHTTRHSKCRNGGRTHHKSHHVAHSCKC